MQDKNLFHSNWDVFTWWDFFLSEVSFGLTEKQLQICWKLEVEHKLTWSSAKYNLTGKLFIETMFLETLIEIFNSRMSITSEF